LKARQAAAAGQARPLRVAEPLPTPSLPVAAAAAVPAAEPELAELFANMQQVAPAVHPKAKQRISTGVLAAGAAALVGVLLLGVFLFSIMKRTPAGPPISAKLEQPGDSGTSNPRDFVAKPVGPPTPAAGQASKAPRGKAPAENLVAPAIADKAPGAVVAPDPYPGGPLPAGWMERTPGAVPVDQKGLDELLDALAAWPGKICDMGTVAQIPLPSTGTVSAMTVLAGKLWIAQKKTLLKLDPDTGEALARFELAAADSLTGLCTDGQVLYGLLSGWGAGFPILVIDPRTGQVARVLSSEENKGKQGPTARAISYLAGSLYVEWGEGVAVVSPDDGRILRRLPADPLSPFRVGPVVNGENMVACGGLLHARAGQSGGKWGSNLYLVDPKSGKVLRSLPLHHPARVVAFDRGTYFIAEAGLAIARESAPDPAWRIDPQPVIHKLSLPDSAWIPAPETGGLVQAEKPPQPPQEAGDLPAVAVVPEMANMPHWQRSGTLEKVPGAVVVRGKGFREVWATLSARPPTPLCDVGTMSEIPFPPQAQGGLCIEGITALAGKLWIVLQGQLWQLDPINGTVLAHFDFQLREKAGLCTDGKLLYVLSYDWTMGGPISVIEPQAGLQGRLQSAQRVRDIVTEENKGKVDDAARAIGYFNGSLYIDTRGDVAVISPADGRVLRRLPASGRSFCRVGPLVNGQYMVSGGLVARPAGPAGVQWAGSLNLFDPNSGQVVKSLPLNHPVGYVAYDRGTYFIAEAALTAGEAGSRKEMSCLPPPRTIHKLVLPEGIWGMTPEASIAEAKTVEGPAAKEGEKSVLRILPLANVAAYIGETHMVPVRIERGGYEGPVSVRLEGLPPGVTAAAGTIQAGQSRALLELAVPKDMAAMKTQVRAVVSYGNATAEAPLQLALGKRSAVQPFVVPLHGLGGYPNMSPVQFSPGLAIAPVRAGAGVSAGAWQAAGAFASLTCPGTLTYPPVPIAHYVLETELEMLAPDARLRICLGDPDCAVHLNVFCKGEKQSVECSLQPVGPSGPGSWGGHMANLEAGERLALKWVVLDGRQVLFHKNQEICKTEIGPADLTLKITAESPGVMIYRCSCRRLREEDVQPLDCPLPQDSLTLDSQEAKARFEALKRGAGNRPVPGKRFAVSRPGTPMAWIPPGEFSMGSTAFNNMGGAVAGKHRVKITRGFWMGQCDVTQGEWTALMPSNPSHVQGSSYLPVDWVTLREALAFCEAVNKSESQRRRVPTGYLYRLPTEAEWEYACRAGSDEEFSVKPADVWSRETSEGRPHEVAEKPPNKWELYDMHGNAMQWCMDVFRHQATFFAAVATDPYYPGRSEREAYVCRGGAWYLPREKCSSSWRGQSAAEPANGYRGFRLVLGPVLNASEGSPGTSPAAPPVRSPKHRVPVLPGNP
jgi:formylglycine-generating enzyme required for sulfatase activity